MGEERRVHERKPIRLKVVYRSATELVTEYTTSVSKGGCRLTSARPLPVGTLFVFEMFSPEEKEPVEVEGSVVRCDTGAEGKFELAIEYAHGAGRSAQLERIIELAFNEQKYDKLRKHVRIPVNLVAADAGVEGQKYLVRDLSIGGMGARLPAGQPLPAPLKKGAPVELRVAFDLKMPLTVLGTVAWVAKGRGGASQASFGIEFRDVSAEAVIVLEAVCRLERPATITLRFG